MPLGVLLLSIAAPAALRLSIVSLILVIALLTLFDVRLPAARTRWAAVGFGFTTTLLTTTLSIGGPVAAIYAIEQDWPRETMRATLAVYFLLAGVLGLALYYVVGLIPQDVEMENGDRDPGRRDRLDGRRVAGTPHEPEHLSLRRALRDHRRQRVAADPGDGEIDLGAGLQPAPSISICPNRLLPDYEDRSWKAANAAVIPSPTAAPSCLVDSARASPHT